MCTSAFWLATAERAVRTAALLAVLTAITASGSGDGPGLTETVRTRT